MIEVRFKTTKEDHKRMKKAQGLVSTQKFMETLLKVSLDALEAGIIEVKK